MFTNKTLYRTTAALLTGCFLFLSCRDNDLTTYKGLRNKKVTVEEVSGIETLYSQGGDLKAKLTAPVLYRYQDTVPRVEFPNTLHVDFYNDSLGVQSKLDALYGRYFENKNKIFLRDSVVVIRISVGDTLRCQELYWDQDAGRFYTDKPVRIYTKDKIIFGKGLTANQDLTDYKIDSITGIVYVKESEFPQ